MYLTLTHEKDPKDPNVPSLRYVKIPKKTMKKTLITYLKPTYLQHFSLDPLKQTSRLAYKTVPLMQDIRKKLIMKTNETARLKGSSAIITRQVFNLFQ